MPVTPDPRCHSAPTERGAEAAASASPARALPRPPSGRVGPAPSPPRPGRAPPGANPPFRRPEGRRPAVGRRRPPAGLASAATPLTFSGGCGRQAPPRGGRLRWPRALPRPVLHQLEVRRVEGVEPGERRDGREHGDLRRARRAERGGMRESRRGAGPGRTALHPPRRSVAPGASSGAPPGVLRRAAPTHLLRWRQRANPLLGRRLGAEADRAPGAVTLSFADARGGAAAQEAAGRLAEALGEPALAAHAQPRPTPLAGGGSRRSPSPEPGRRPAEPRRGLSAPQGCPWAHGLALGCFRPAPQLRQARERLWLLAEGPPPAGRFLGVPQGHSGRRCPAPEGLPSGSRVRARGVSDETLSTTTGSPPQQLASGLGSRSTAVAL